MRLASLAHAVSIGAWCSAGWHSTLRGGYRRPVLSVTYKRGSFGSHVAYSSLCRSRALTLFSENTNKEKQTCSLEPSKGPKQIRERPACNNSCRFLFFRFLHLQFSRERRARKSLGTWTSTSHFSSTPETRNFRPVSTASTCWTTLIYQSWKSKVRTAPFPLSSKYSSQTPTPHPRRAN